MSKLKFHEIAPICDTLLEGKVKNCHDFFYYRNYYKDFLDKQSHHDFVICDKCPWFYRNYCYKKAKQLDEDVLGCELFNFRFSANYKYQRQLAVFIDGSCAYDCWWCIGRTTAYTDPEFDFDKFEETLKIYPNDSVLLTSTTDPLNCDPAVIHRIIDICEKHNKYVDIVSHDYLLDKFDILDRIRTLYLVCYREWYDKEKELSIEYALGICSVTLVLPVVPDKGMFKRNSILTHGWYIRTILKWYPLVDNIEIRETHFTDKYLMLAAREGFKRLVSYFISRKYIYSNTLKAVPYSHNLYYYYFPDGSIYDDPYKAVATQGLTDDVFWSEVIKFDRRIKSI